MLEFRRLLSRRWLLALLGGIAMLFAVAMSHPYARQSLFGPTIAGKPRCYWEHAIRDTATHDKVEAKRTTVEKKLREWCGVRRELLLTEPGFFRHEELLPLLLELAEDADEEVRRLAAFGILYHDEQYQEPALPILRKHLEDDDPMNRIYAARGVWRISKDKQVIPVLLKIIHATSGKPLPGLPVRDYSRSSALREFAEIARDLPELFPNVVRYATHEDECLRSSGVFAMRHFGKKGLPTVVQGLDDPSENVRFAAAGALRYLGEDARPAIPALKRLLTDPDSNVRHQAIEALVAIDRDAFEHLKWER
jgi:hypothetical protein